MTSWVTTNYQIAAGHNNTAALTLVTSLTSSGMTAIVEPVGIHLWTLGERRVALNGKVLREGFKSTAWEFSYLTVVQLKYLRHTFEGFVTIKTAIDGVTWGNYNAVLSVPDASELSYVAFITDVTRGYVGGGYQNVRLTFTRLEAI